MSTTQHKNRYVWRKRLPFILRTYCTTRPLRQLNNWEYPYRCSNLFLLKAKEDDL